MVNPMLEKSFEEVFILIQSTRAKVVRTVNQELIKLYWEVGKYITDKIEASEWGDSVVDGLANYLSEKDSRFKRF